MNVNIIGRQAITAATAAKINNIFERLRLVTRRAASAMIPPAKGAKRMVKNPIRAAIKLPRYASTPTVMNTSG